jgi:hypothetical protein
MRDMAISMMRAIGDFANDPLLDVFDEEQDIELKDLTLNNNK